MHPDPHQPPPEPGPSEPDQTSAIGPATRGRRLVVQLLALVVSLGLLAWCLSRVLTPANRAKLAELSEKPPGLIALLLALSLASLLLTGTSFYATIRPARRLNFAGVQAVNAVASLLGYLPFKLSLVSRILLHHRRDGLPILTGSAWLVAQAVTMLATLVPLAGVGLWRGQVDGLYALAASLGLLGSWALLTTLARVFAGARGLSRLHRLAGPLRVVTRAAWFARLHAGVDMLAHPRAVAGAMAARTLDLLAQSARFVVAAHAMDLDLSWSGAILAASTFFLLGVLSPAGAVGGREGGTTGLAALVALPGLPTDTIALVSVVVSASEIIVYTIAGLLAAAWLRPLRLLRTGAGTPRRH